MRSPRTFALDDLINTEANIVVLQLLAEYYIVKIGLNTLTFTSKIQEEKFQILSENFSSRCPLIPMSSKS